MKRSAFDLAELLRSVQRRITLVCRRSVMRARRFPFELARVCGLNSVVFGCLCVALCVGLPVLAHGDLVQRGLDQASPRGIEDARRETARGGSRIVAERAFAEGERLRAESSLESSRKAISKYEEAIRQWRVTGDSGAQVKALKAVGEVYYSLGDAQRAVQYLEQGLLLTRQSKDLRAEGEILSAAGFAYLHLGENQKAFEYCERALKLSREAGNNRGEARALNYIAETYYH